jgi:superfamily II RNA helicase
MFPALYFIYSRKLTEKLAYELLDRDPSPIAPLAAQARRDLNGVLDAFEDDHPEVLTPRLRALYSIGVASHHAGLHVALKSLVERLYEMRLLRVLYCTSTFALGVNMPARTVIFDALTKFNGTDVVPLTVREFMQIAGRSGRRGIDDAGDVVVRMDFSTFGDQSSVWRTLTQDSSEPVNSSFNLSFHSVVNLLGRLSEDEIRLVVDKSFRAYQDGVFAEDLRAELDGVLACAPRNPGRDNQRQVAGLRRRLVEADRPRLWEQFQRKVSFLRQFDYIDHHNQLLGPGLILRQIHFAEVLVTELIMEGFVVEFSGSQLFGALCGLVQTLPKAVKVHRPDRGQWRVVEERLLDVLNSDVVVGAERMTGVTLEFCPELMSLGSRWSEGASLAELLDDVRSPTDISGDLVGAFRRAKDLVRQIRGVYADEEAISQRLRTVLRAVTRDEVEAVY